MDEQMYHLPLLPGYGPGSNIRSSVPSHTPGRKSLLSRLSEAEEDGYQDTYFASPAPRSPSSVRDGYMSSGSPVDTRRPVRVPDESEPDADDEEERQPKRKEDEVAEVVFFEYGVVVFFGLDEGQERGILEDLDNAGVLKRPIKEDDWEVEECHFAVRFPSAYIQTNLLSLRLYSMTHTFYIPVYTMISSVSFSSARPLYLNFTTTTISIQIPLSPSQAIRCARPRSIDSPSTLRIQRSTCPVRPTHSCYPPPTGRFGGHPTQTRRRPTLNRTPVQIEERR